MSAVKCPVCEGKTTVPVGFYEDKTITCKACSGRGVVFDPFTHTPTPSQEGPWLPYTNPTVTSDRTSYRNQVSLLSDRPDWRR